MSRKTKKKFGESFFCGFFLFFFIFVPFYKGNTEGIMPDVEDVDIALSQHDKLMISTFDIDITPTPGVLLETGIQTNKGNLGLRAKGIVILGEEPPIVLCAVDWIGILHSGFDLFKRTLAIAAGTVPERVSVHTLHIHDAPRFDPDAEEILMNLRFDSTRLVSIHDQNEFAMEKMNQLAAEVRKSIQNAKPINYLGLGQAAVHKVASNRDVDIVEGKVRKTRFSASHDSLLRSLPIGTIDSILSTVSFWYNDDPIAILNFYATHPMSYYGTGTANPDFVGVARYSRQLATPDALQIYFTGAAGNVAAGKYNDGSHINRLILANRLEDGMRRAWNATYRQSITSNDVDWFVEKVTLPPADFLKELESKVMKSEVELTPAVARRIAWLRWTKANKTEISCLKIKNMRLLFLPGEPFVEYQIAAKSMQPDLFVAVSGYGQYGPGYIGTEKAYKRGGYETERDSFVSPEVESVMTTAISRLLYK